jgi:hypothetical protein
MIQEQDITADVIKRFSSKLRPQTNGCVIWDGMYRRAKGIRYPVLSIKGKTVNARIVAWYFKHDEPPKRFLRVTCENQSCVSPDHVISVAQIDEAVNSPNSKRFQPGHSGWTKV